MTKDINKNLNKNIIFTVLLALVVLGLTGGTASAAAPIITSATLNYSDGVLVITGTEFSSVLDKTKFHLNNATGIDDVNLSESDSFFITDTTILTITLTEANRVAALAISGKTGGDGGAVVLDVDAGAVVDSGSIPNLIADNRTVTETEDALKPTVTSATLNYSTGVLVVTFSETINASATNASKFHLNNVTDTDVVTLSTAPTDVDATTLTFTLTEAQRVAALAISGETGGDGEPVVLDVDALAVTDMAANTNLEDDNNTVTETADTVKPTVTSATLNYSTGVLVVTFSETINASATNASKFHLNNVTETDVVNISVAPADVDATTLTFTLTEAQRVAARAISATTGGDGSEAVVLDVDADGVADMAGNTNDIDDDNTVTETPTLVVAGAGTTIYNDVDGQVSQSVANLTLTAAGTEIGTGTTVNITLSDANVSFDTSVSPTLAHTTGSGTILTLTTNTATELGFAVTGENSTASDVFELGAVKVNITAGTLDTTIVNFNVTTNSSTGSVVEQYYDALTIDYQEPNAVTITHNDADDSVVVGTNVVLTAHAASANIANYGGWQINFSIITAPAPLTWTTNGMNSSFSNTTLDQYEEVTTGSDGDATLNLKLSTRSSATKTDVQVQLNGTAVAAVNLSDGTDESITTVDDVETHINVTSNFESAIADGTETITFTAQLRDQFDNFVENGTNVTSTFGVGITGNADSTSIPTSFVNGTETVVVTDTTQESVTVSFDSAEVGIDTGSKTVNYVSDAYGISLTANRTSAPADVSSVIRVYAQLLDINGSSLALHKDTGTWSYSQSNLIFGTGGTFGDVNETGIITLDLTSAAESGTTVVTVRYTNATSVVMKNTISLTTTQSVNAGNSAASASSVSIEADDKVTYTVTVNDDDSQPVENAEVTFKIEDGNGTLTNAYNALENATGLNQTLTVLSNATGGVTVEYFNRNASESNSVNITVVDGGVVTKLSAAPYAVTVTPANASTIVLTPASLGLTNINATAGNILISLTDAYGNVVTDPLVINVTNLNPTLGDLSTDATGQITLNASGQGTVTFTVDSAPLQDSATIQFDALTSYNSAYLATNVTGFTALVTTSGPSDVVVSFNATTPVVGDIVEVSAQLTDADGNSLSIADKVLTFIVLKAGETVPFDTGLDTTDANGIAIFNLDVTELGTYTVTASNTSLGLSNSSSITFAGNMASIVATVNDTEGTYTAPVNSTVIVNATAMDNGGNVATSASGDVTFLIGADSIGQDSFTAGVASISYTNSVAGTYSIMAYFNSTVYGMVNVTFSETAVLTTITVTPATADLVVNGTQNFTATTLDQFGASIDATVTWASSNTSVGTINATTGVFTAVAAGTTNVTATSGSVTGTAVVTVTTEAVGAPALVSALTPNSRTAQVGTPVTVFMSVINYGTAAATGVSITQESSLPATVSYQTWDGTALTGTADTPVDMAAGETVNFVLTINATSAFSSSAMTFNVSGTNVATAPISGVNTLTMSANATLPPDVIMISTSLSVSTVVDTPTAFAVATYNVGANATGVSFLVDVPSGISGLVYQVNETNLDGSIKGPATGLTIATGEMPTFAVFLTPTAAIANDPANNRITIKLVDGSSNVIGAQSIAVYTT